MAIAWAQELEARWMQLVERSTGGLPELKDGTTAAWRDRRNWPAMLQAELDKWNLDEVTEFIGKATAWRLKTERRRP